jgi:hypothetical protein
MLRGQILDQLVFCPLPTPHLFPHPHILVFQVMLPRTLRPAILLQLVREGRLRLGVLVPSSLACHGELVNGRVARVIGRKEGREGKGGGGEARCCVQAYEATSR